MLGGLQHCGSTEFTRPHVHAEDYIPAPKATLASPPHRISLRHSALLCGAAYAPLRISLRLRLGFCDSPSRGE